MTGRAVGWHRGEWEELTGIAGLGPELPPYRPGCGSLSVDPDHYAIFLKKCLCVALVLSAAALLLKDRLHAIGLQHKASWATGNLLRDMQEPPKPPAKPAEAPAAGRLPAANNPQMRQSMLLR